jgi:hypothetical protein
MNKVMALQESLVRTSNFRDREGRELTVRRMPAFFETFPVILVDGWYHPCGYPLSKEDQNTVLNSRVELMLVSTVEN